MAGIRSIFEGEADDPKVLQKAIEKLVELYPTVGELFTGVAGKGDQDAIGKFFLSFRCESDGLTVQISRQGVDMDIYVKISDPLTPWACIESALTGGQFTRRKRDKRVPSF